MAEIFTPNREHHKYEIANQEIDRVAYAKEFMQTMRRYMETLRGGDTSIRAARAGSEILQALLKLQQYSAETFDYEGAKSLFYKQLGPAPNAKSLAEIKGIFTGFRGELGAIKSAESLGLGVYHATTKEDMTGIDVIFDTNPLELEDYLTKGSEGLPYEEQTYDYIMASVKCSEMFPATGDFPIYFPCRTLQELTDALDEHRDSYYGYYRNEGWNEDRIDAGWDHTGAVAYKAAERLHGMSAQGVYRNGYGLTERYENVVPAVILMPGSESLIQKNGQPKSFIVDRFYNDFYE